MRHKNVSLRGKFARAVHTTRHWKWRSFCSSFVTHQKEKTIWYSWNMLKKHIFPFNRTFSLHPACTRERLSLPHVPGSSPLAWADLKFIHIRRKCYLRSVTLGKVGNVISVLRRFPADLSLKYFSGWATKSGFWMTPTSCKSDVFNDWNIQCT